MYNLSLSHEIEDGTKFYSVDFNDNCLCYNTSFHTLAWLFHGREFFVENKKTGKPGQIRSRSNARSHEPGSKSQLIIHVEANPTVAIHSKVSRWLN